MNWRDIVYAGEPKQPRRKSIFGNGEPTVLSRSLALAITAFLTAMCCLAVVQIVGTAVYDRVAADRVVGEVVSCQGEGTRGESCVVRYQVGGEAYTTSVAMSSDVAGTQVELYANPADPGGARTIDVGALIVFPLAAVGLLIATLYQVSELRAARRGPEASVPPA